VAVFNCELDKYEKLSNNMSLENCSGFINSKRADNKEDFVIIVVLDE
jgi:hypothetical protein